MPAVTSGVIQRSALMHTCLSLITTGIGCPLARDNGGGTNAPRRVCSLQRSMCCTAFWPPLLQPVATLRYKLLAIDVMQDW